MAPKMFYDPDTFFQHPNPTTGDNPLNPTSGGSQLYQGSLKIVWRTPARAVFGELFSTQRAEASSVEEWLERYPHPVNRVPHATYRASTGQVSTWIAGGGGPYQELLSQVMAGQVVAPFTGTWVAPWPLERDFSHLTQDADPRLSLCQQKVYKGGGGGSGERPLCPACAEQA
ncbi:hypothetical protein [Nocardiopsis sp. NPDC006938]|uniref:hypothetical protein n=1 Tax=Nocardiopsis sp. NPDC006938 TaxID=3364337 RepID=UPI0036C93713